MTETLAGGASRIISVTSFPGTHGHLFGRAVSMFKG